MKEIIETGNITEVVSTPLVPKVMTFSQTIGNLVYFAFGILETALLFRLFFKLAGANPLSAFVSWINSVTGVFVAPFEGIFSRTVNQGANSTSIFEPSTFLAMIIYGVIALGFVKLILILSREKEEVINI